MDDGVVRYCGKCNKTLLATERQCPNPDCTGAKIKTLDTSLYQVLEASPDLCRENPKLPKI